MAMAGSRDQENGPRYTIPSWFLENNVQTNADTVNDEPGLAVVDNVLGQDEGDTRLAVFEILRDDYDAIQLTAAAALIRDGTNALSAKTPSILLDMKENDEPVPGGVDYFDSLVKRLARDLGAYLISVSPDDLEELGREFYLQDQNRQKNTTKQQSSMDGMTEDTGIEASTDEKALPSEQPHWDSAYALVQFYFGVRSERNGTAESQERSKAAINALLDSAIVKRGIALEKESANVGNLDSLVLLHLMDVQLLEYRNPRCRVLRRFAHRLEERRTAAEGGAQKILGIASETALSTPHRECTKFLSDEQRIFRISLPPNYSAQKDFYMRQESFYIRMRNIRRFKRRLQARLRKVFEPGLLDLYDSEHVRQRWLNEVFTGGKACCTNDLDRAAIQVAGRQWSNPTLTLDDVISVTTRMRRNGNWDGEEELEEDKKHEKNEQQGSNRQNPWEGLTLKERQDKVSPLCDKHESKLLDCIVNPEELSTTYDDVIIDEEAKEHMKQLISLSRIRLEATSRILLQNLSMSGALFYGAPGTGKTLLCKAIANDSSSNMLSLTPSDVQNKWAGETEKIISASFSLAAKLSPCVLFIDEVDALFYRRSSCDKSWERSALNQFLQEMDGLTTQNKGNAPFVIVGTNRPGDLDDAFLRRLPHKVLFTLPPAADRERILRVFLHKDDVDPLLDFNDLANKTKGFSGSDIRSLCGHAALAWAVEQAKKQPGRDVATVRVHLQQHHFDKALSKTKPTVSPQSTKALEEFAKRFNSEDYNRPFISINNSNITSATSSTPVPAIFVPQTSSHISNSPQPQPHDMSSISSSGVATAMNQISNMHLEGTPSFTLESPPPAEATSNFGEWSEGVTAESIFTFPADLSFLESRPAGRSLGRVSEDCVGIVEIENSRQIFGITDMRPMTMIRGLMNWYRLQFLVSRGFADRIFSWEQRYSYQVLYDWWSASFQHPSIPLTYLVHCIGLSDVLSGEYTRSEFGDHKETWVCILHHLDSLYEAGGRSQDKLDMSPYTQAIWNLFLFEFGYSDAYTAGGGPDMTALASSRQDAILKAYCQLAAVKCSRNPLPGPPLHKLSDEPLSVLSVEASDPSCPRTLSRGPMIRACPWLDISPATSFAYSQNISGDEDELGGWPEYLWEISNRRTVRTRDLKNKRPAYVAISHTWGRWQLRDQWTHIEGGLELPIPCNSMFDVNKLPEMLTKLNSLNNRIAVDYVWLDLLCIPQVPLGGMEDVYQPWIPIQMREIARQGSIFRNAWAAVAWFHDIHNLSCLGALFELFSLSFLSFDPDSTDDMQRRNIEEAAYSRIRQSRTGFLSKDAETNHDPKSQTQTLYEPNSWFTSLWTLQEVCLRPDMWLATSDWNLLTIGQDEPVPLSGLVAVQLQKFKGVSRDEFRTEPAAAEIAAWSIATGLHDLLWLSRVDILRLGDRRRCSGKRAEAIMSAIGATKWFLRDANHEESLVLGVYPHAFIQEIRESISGAFFATFAKIPGVDAYDKGRVTKIKLNGLHGRGLVQSYENAKIRGSLLPFSNMGHFYFQINRTLTDDKRLETHDSIRSWEITTSGTVKIGSACILSSSTLTDIPKLQDELPCHFEGFYTSAEDHNRGRLRFYRDIHKWMGARKSEIHLVVVMHMILEKTAPSDNTFISKQDPFQGDRGIDNSEEAAAFRKRRAIHGIVLRSTKEDSLRTAKKEGKIQGADGKPQRLVKIGTFCAWDHGEVGFPETRKVSWEIL